MREQTETGSSDKAKQYQSIKKRLMLLHLFLTPLLLAFWSFSGTTTAVRALVSSWCSHPAAEVGLFFTLFSVFFFVIDFPLSFYSGFILEHCFSLSNLSFGGWLKEMLKRSLLSYAFSLLLIEGLYLLIRFQPQTWWFWSWAGYAGISWVLGKLFPVFIVPLFYKYLPIPEGELRSRILALLSRYDLPAANLFSLNLSKTTKKANAAFMGLGKTKRVVLSDTLLEQFTPAEIEQVVAHELGHFKHKDIWKQLGLGLVISFVCFLAGFYGVEHGVNKLHLKSAADVAGLPLLMLIFMGVHYLSLPVVNGFSRVCEYAADRFALDACGDRDVFISMMDKLGKVNLADPSPAAWYEWLFYDHPSIQKRISAARAWSPQI